MVWGPEHFMRRRRAEWVGGEVLFEIEVRREGFNCRTQSSCVTVTSKSGAFVGV